MLLQAGPAGAQGRENLLDPAGVSVDALVLQHLRRSSSMPAGQWSPLHWSSPGNSSLPLSRRHGRAIRPPSHAHPDPDSPLASPRTEGRSAARNYAADFDRGGHERGRGRHDEASHVLSVWPAAATAGGASAGAGPQRSPSKGTARV
jgi:hypothetical protein